MTIRIKLENLNMIDDKPDIREIVNGDFLEGEKVTVNIDGEIITRKVFWSGSRKDLAIRFQNKIYGYSEFWNR